MTATLMLSDGMFFGNTGNSVGAETGSIFGAQSGPPSMSVMAIYRHPIGGLQLLGSWSESSVTRSEAARVDSGLMLDVCGTQFTGSVGIEIRRDRTRRLLRFQDGSLESVQSIAVSVEAN
jgi:hypothetical protein